MINWAEKLSSRKFWAMLVALLSSILIAFNVNAEDITKIVAVVGGFGSVAMYIFAEASVDKARAENPPFPGEIIVDDEDDEPVVH